MTEAEEIAELRKALAGAAAVIAAIYEMADRADATSISGIAACNTMLMSLKKNKDRTTALVIEPARAALARAASANA